MPQSPPVTLQVSEYMPDLPAFQAGASMTVQNVLPKTAQSYGPFPSFKAYATAALPLRCQGAATMEDPEGDVFVFAGPATDLYTMNIAGPTFTNVSKSAAAYNINPDDLWNFATFNNRMIASNIADPMQSYSPDVSTTFTDLSAAAPKAKYITTAKNFLIAANTNDAVYGPAPWRVWWGALGDPTNWPTPGSALAQELQSDYNDTVGQGGLITGIVGNLGTADVAVFYEHAVWKMIYVGPPAVFDFVPAEGVRGTHAPASIVQLGAVVFYLGEDGFYMFDGTNSVPIGANKVDKTFFADCDPGGFDFITGSIDPVNKIVMWAYPGQNNTQLVPNRIIAYNWVTQRWAIAYTSVELLFRALTFGYTLDSLDVTGYNLDTLPFSLDSQAWAGGSLLMGAFDPTHTLGYMNGPALAPTVDTEERQFFQGQRAFFRNARPLVDADVPTVAVGTRDKTEDTVNFNVGTAMNDLGWCPQRGSGRLMRARITLPAGSSFTHIQGTELDVSPVGVR